MQPPPPENAGDKATWRVAATEARRPGSTARLPPSPRVGTRRTPALPAPRAAAAPAGPTRPVSPGEGAQRQLLNSVDLSF